MINFNRVFTYAELKHLRILPNQFYVTLTNDEENFFDNLFPLLEFVRDNKEKVQSVTFVMADSVNSQCIAFTSKELGL